MLCRIFNQNLIENFFGNVRSLGALLLWWEIYLNVKVAAYLSLYLLYFAGTVQVYKYLHSDASRL